MEEWERVIGMEKKIRKVKRRRTAKWVLKKLAMAADQRETERGVKGMVLGKTWTTEGRVENGKIVLKKDFGRLNYLVTPSLVTFIGFVVRV